MADEVHLSLYDMEQKCIYTAARYFLSKHWTVAYLDQNS